jgi:hypothetical protein
MRRGSADTAGVLVDRDESVEFARGSGEQLAVLEAAPPTSTTVRTDELVEIALAVVGVCPRWYSLKCYASPART